MFAKVRKGTGGATRAFLHNRRHRIKQMEPQVGYTPYPGSLNLLGEEDFAWELDSRIRGQVDDVFQRGHGLNCKWIPRDCGFHPLTIKFRGVSIKCHAFRFEGERYSLSFVELIAPVCLRKELDLYDTAEVELIQEEKSNGNT